MSSCAAPTGPPCRTGKGRVAAQYHTARFRLVPHLARALSVPVPALRKPGSAWTEMPRPGSAGTPPAGRVRIGYARASTARQLLDTQVDSLKASPSSGHCRPTASPPWLPASTSGPATATSDSPPASTPSSAASKQPGAETAGNPAADQDQATARPSRPSAALRPRLHAAFRTCKWANTPKKLARQRAGRSNSSIMILPAEEVAGPGGYLCVLEILRAAAR
jgi:hypothetical protein